MHANQTALGERQGTTTITLNNRGNIGWNSIIPGFLPDSAIAEKIEVPLTTLDGYLTDNEIKPIRIIKIDVEGYEYFVLKGCRKYLSQTKQLPILIVEISPVAYPLINASLKEFSGFLAGFGYEAYTLGFRRKIDINSLKINTDIVFIPR